MEVFSLNLGLTLQQVTLQLPDLQIIFYTLQPKDKRFLTYNGQH
jgi:hypothetical protein